MNGYLWTVVLVPPNSIELVDRTGELRVATTDPVSRTVFLSNDLQGDFLKRVLLHELGHVAMISFGLLTQIHRMTKPRDWIEMEEWICNFIADYGSGIFETANRVL